MIISNLIKGNVPVWIKVYDGANGKPKTVVDGIGRAAKVMKIYGMIDFDDVVRIQPESRDHVSYQTIVVKPEAIARITLANSKKDGNGGEASGNQQELDFKN